MAPTVYTKRQKVGSYKELVDVNMEIDISHDAGENCEVSGNDEGNPQGGNDSQGPEDDNENSEGTESGGEEDPYYPDNESEASEGADSAGNISDLEVGARDGVIVKCVFNARTHHMIMTTNKYSVYKEQSCVWPPMVVVCFKSPMEEELKCRYLEGVRMKLVAEAKLESVKLIEDVCSEVPYSFNLFLLPPNGVAFVAAKAIDTIDCERAMEDKLDGPWSFYPSYRDMCDIRAGQIPESTRQFFVLLPHRTKKASWVDKHSMYGGKDKLLFEDSMKSMVPLVCGSEICLPKIPGDEEENGGSCSGAPWYMKVQSMMEKIEESDKVFRSQSLEVGASSEPFFKKLKAFEEQKMKEVEETVAKTNVNESLMHQLWTINGTIVAKGVLMRLKHIDKLIQPDAKSALLCQMRWAGEGLEMNLLSAIDWEINRQKYRNEQLAKMNVKAEKSIFVLREQQHKEFLQRLEQNQQLKFSQLEVYIDEKFKFVAGVRVAKMETESILRWNAEHTANAVDKVRETHNSEKKKLKAQMLAANLEKKKLEEQVSMAKTEVHKMKKQVEKERRLMKEDNRKFQVAVHSNEATRILVLKQSAEMEKSVLEKKIQKVETMNKDLEAKVRAAEINLKDKEGMLFEVTEIMKESSTKFTCAICFNNLEGYPTKKHVQDSDDSNPNRKRACFLPCMHANMCTECSVAAWESHRRCPICNTPTSRCRTTSKDNGNGQPHGIAEGLTASRVLN